MTGNWNVDVTVGRMPQKVATACGKLNEYLIGAEYTPIAYLGSQVVNGTNHAVLAEQLVLSGKDTKNIVLLTFNEKPNDVDMTLVGIDRVVESGPPMGGTHIDVKTDFPADIMAAWNDAFEGYVGMKVVPFAYLGTQVTKGMSFIFAATAEPVTLDPVAQAVIVTVNPMTKNVSFNNILETRQENSLGYAFTW